LYEEKSLVDQHQAEPIYSALRFRETNGWLFDDPAFKVLSAAVREFEDLERQGCTDTFSPSRHKTAQAAAQAVTHALRPTLLAIATTTAHMASQMQTQVTTATEAQETQATHNSQVMQQLVAVAAVAAVDRYDRGDGNLRNLSAAQLAAAEQLRSSRGLPPIHARGQRLPPPPPATPVTAAVTTAAIAAAATAIAAVATATTAALPSAKRQRQRQVDGPGLRQVAFGELLDIRHLWAEYAGKGGLRHRELQTPRWKEGNRQARDMFYDKLFFYREIARQAGALAKGQGLDQALGLEQGLVQALCLEQALDATQARLDQGKGNRSRGWTKLLRVLTVEQPQDGEVRAKLTHMLCQLKV